MTDRLSLVKEFIDEFLEQDPMATAVFVGDGATEICPLCKNTQEHLPECLYVRWQALQLPPMFWMANYGGAQVYKMSPPLVNTGPVTEITTEDGKVVGVVEWHQETGFNQPGKQPTEWIDDYGPYTDADAAYDRTAHDKDEI